MKKLILLISLLIVTSTTFSKTVTKQDTIVPLKVSTAKLIIKDLIKGDAAVKEVIELEKIIKLKDEQINNFREKDKLKNEKINNLEQIIYKKDEQITYQREIINSLDQQLRKEKKKSSLLKIGTYIGIISTSLLIIK